MPSQSRIYSVSLRPLLGSLLLLALAGNVLAQLPTPPSPPAPITPPAPPAPPAPGLPPAPPAPGLPPSPPQPGLPGSGGSSTPHLDDHAGSGTSSARLVSSYSGFAGSGSNASSLVQGLQSGSRITLTPTGPATPANAPASFTPATSRMGLGEVNIALAIAKADLARAGISQPTPGQMQAALNGGTVTTANGTSVRLAGVLAQRQSGLGWGQIAKASGLSLGAVVSESKTDKAGKKARKDTHKAAAARKSATSSKRSLHKGSSAGASGTSKGGSSHGGGNAGGGNGGGKK